jgi:hypothetical protein
MSSQSATRALTAVVVLGAALAGCADIYGDRREMISLASGDALAANKVVQTIDPWPPHSARNRIAFSGERMQIGTERYKMNRSITPVNVTTSSAAYQRVQQDAAAANAAIQASSATPAAPVKGNGSGNGGNQ